jgi:hypothetical protein
MIKYEDFLSEMALRSGKARDTSDYTYEEEFSTWVQDKSTFPMVADNIEGKYRVYRTPSMLFLSSLDDKYLGYIKLINPRSTMKALSAKVFVIQGSHSNLQGGFYKLMFNIIFTVLHYDIILSDLMMSDEAIHSWEKMLKGNPKACVFSEADAKLEDYTPNKIDYFSDDDMNYRVGLKK